MRIPLKKVGLLNIQNLIRFRTYIKEKRKIYPVVTRSVYHSVS